MKTVADLLLEMCVGEPISLAGACERLAVEAQHVRAAMRALNESGRADLVYLPGEREMQLARLTSRCPGQRNVCFVCQTKFERPAKSKRRTCSRSCAVAASWRGEASRASRVASIAVAKRTPEARAHSKAASDRRWARPGEREKLAESSRARWADPAMNAKMSREIRRAQQLPEQREVYANIRRRHWQDPEKRKRMEEGIRRSKQSPEARAKFSALLKARWQDPKWRAKYMASSRRNAKLAGAANRDKTNKSGDAP